MRETSPAWTHGVVLVCENQRPDGAPKPSCGRARGQAVKSWLKPALQEAGGAGAGCRVLTTSCLDTCPADGVAIALEPGHKVLVFNPDAPDPQVEQQALLARIQAHFEAVGAAAATPEAAGGRARRLLGRLRGR